EEHLRQLAVSAGGVELAARRRVEAGELGNLAVEHETVDPPEKPQRERVEHGVDAVRSASQYLGAKAVLLGVVDRHGQQMPVHRAGLDAIPLVTERGENVVEAHATLTRHTVT